MDALTNVHAFPLVTLLCQKGQKQSDWLEIITINTNVKAMNDFLRWFSKIIN